MNTTKPLPPFRAKNIIRASEEDSRRNAKFTVTLAKAADMLDGLAAFERHSSGESAAQNIRDMAALLRDYGMLRPYGSARTHTSRN